MNFSIIGTGALGGYYGALLAQAGNEVHFLLRTESEAEHIKKKGLKVESPKGNFVLNTQHVTSHPESLAKANVVIIALKTTQNHLLSELLPKVCGPDSIVLCLQNGIGNEDLIHSILPNNPIIGGLCFLCSNKLGPGHICHLDYGPIRMGAYHPLNSKAGDYPVVASAALLEIADIFNDARIFTTVVEDLFLARWMKLVWNIPYNGICTLLDKTTDEIMNTEYLRQQVRELMFEVQTAAAAWGKIIPESFIQKMLTDTEKMAAYKPSMLVDFRMNRLLEWKYLYEKPVQLAEKKGVKMPQTQLVGRLLRAISG